MGSGGAQRDSATGSGSGSQQLPAGAGGGGAITSAERAAILDERLRRGYETFDGFILSERERAQTESNAAGSVNPGGSGGGGGGAAGGQNQPQTMEQASSAAAAGAAEAVSQSSPSSSREEVETFPPPDDIPSGRDDDVVARQIREAAMTEPDPELREALWEQYRVYTGIGDQ